MRQWGGEAVIRRSGRPSPRQRTTTVLEHSEGLSKDFSLFDSFIRYFETPVTVTPQQKISETSSSSKILKRILNVYLCGDNVYFWGDNAFTVGEITFTFGEKKSVDSGGLSKSFRVWDSVGRGALYWGQKKYS